MENKIVIHTDGGARGNPGPAAAAFTVHINGKEIFRASKFLGRTTNNQAEYGGVLMAVDWLHENFKKPFNSSINFILDSELVVRQINGQYKVRDANIKIIFDRIMAKIKNMGTQPVFQHVVREQNKIADLLVNQELDKNA